MKCGINWNKRKYQTIIQSYTALIMRIGLDYSAADVKSYTPTIGENTLDKKPIIPNELRAYYDTWHFSPAIESEGFLFISGCTGTRLDGSISDDIEEQVRQAFETMEKSLIEAGLSFPDVIDMTTYHVGLRNHIKKFMEVKDEFIGEPYPAWTAVGVTELAVQGALIEIRVIAKTKNG